MNKLLKAGLLGIYLLALLSLVVELPANSGGLLQKITLILFPVHALEAVVMFKHVKAYDGPLAKSIVLTLLFGLLHWMPIAKAKKNIQPAN